MPGENLTRQEAQARSAIIDVDSYIVEVNLTQDPKVFSYVSTVRFACSEEGQETFIDAITASVESIELNGLDLDPSEYSDGTRITLPNLKSENVLTVKANGVFSNLSLIQI